MLYSNTHNSLPLSLYARARDEKIEIYRDLVSIFRGDDTERFLSRIYDLSFQYQLDFDLVIRWLYTESRFNPGAVSHMGAVGICQLMPPTAELIARIIGYPKYDLFNEDDNLNLGFAFFALLLRESDYNYEKALARYLAGPNWRYHIESRYVRFITEEEPLTVL